MNLDLLLASVWLGIFIMNIFIIKNLNDDGALNTLLKYTLTILWITVMSYLFIDNLIDYLVFALKG